MRGNITKVDLDTVVVPAGASSAYVRVRFFRTTDMMEKAVRLVLRLEENEYFKCYFPEYKNTNAHSATGALIHGDMYTFSLSEMYTEPSYWTWFGGDFFGSWTPRKYVVVNMVCGLTPRTGVMPGMPGLKWRMDVLAFLLLQFKNIYRSRRMPKLPNWIRTGVICSWLLPTRWIIPGMNNIKMMML